MLQEFQRRALTDLVRRLQDESAKWIHGRPDEGGGGTSGEKTKEGQSLLPHSLVYLCRDVYHLGVLSSQRSPVRNFQPSFPVQIDSDFFTCKAAGVIPYRVDPVTRRVYFLFHTYLQEENMYRGVFTDFGGKVEMSDSSPRVTALREFFEESRFLFDASLERVPAMVQRYYPSFAQQTRIFLYNPSSKYMVYFWKLPDELVPRHLHMPQIHCQWISDNDILCDLSFHNRVHFRIRHYHLKRKVIQITVDERNHASFGASGGYGRPPPPGFENARPNPYRWHLMARDHRDHLRAVPEKVCSEGAPSTHPSTEAPSTASTPRSLDLGYASK